VTIRPSLTIDSAWARSFMGCRLGSREWQRGRQPSYFRPIHFRPIPIRPAGDYHTVSRYVKDRSARSNRSRRGRYSMGKRTGQVLFWELTFGQQRASIGRKMSQTATRERGRHEPRGIRRRSPGSPKTGRERFDSRWSFDARHDNGPDRGKVTR